MAAIAQLPLAQAIPSFAIPLDGSTSDYDDFLTLLGDARFVLLGEASHGTHEFYRERARITRRLIEEKGFGAVAIEGDWPDAYRVNRFVCRPQPGEEAVDALEGFRRFPSWMWRNADVLDFVGWLRDHNARLGKHARPVGFFGLDLYSLHASMDAVIEYLGKVDRGAADRARERYACFDHFGPDVEAYAYATHLGLQASCERDVVDQLVEMRRRAHELTMRDGRLAEDEYFYAEQNARVAANAEHYYRTMLDAEIPSWNLRDTHMTETLERLAAHIDRRDPTAKIVVWAHNSHVGDARVTEMARRGEINLGQLMRQGYPRETITLGFTTYTGTVTAASVWHGAPERKTVRPARHDSFEWMLHAAGAPRFYFDLRAHRHDVSDAHEARLGRAIGVIYRPETERQSHYFASTLIYQFDALVHVDVTRAVEPLEKAPEWGAGEVPETYPSGV